jgi:predicted DNA-binding protein (MmcQ/YjbR family)
MSLQSTAEKLRAYALTYPETFEEAPWGDRVVKVRGKIFFFCGVHDKQLYVTAKLPKSGRALLKREYAAPTHYGMGKHGWVTCKFTSEKEVPEVEVLEWIGESFAAVAPKRLVAGLATDSAKKPIVTKQPANTPAKAKSPPRPKARAVLVCSDGVRAQRAVDALAERAVAVAVVDDGDGLKLGRAKALIVDIGRNPREGIALAERIDASDTAVHLFVTGVRDADQERKLRVLGSAEAFRSAPGDAAVAEAVARAIIPERASRAKEGGARRAR